MSYENLDDKQQRLFSILIPAVKHAIRTVYGEKDLETITPIVIVSKIVKVEDNCVHSEDSIVAPVTHPQHLTTIFENLLEELNSHESGISDALSPFFQEYDKH